MKRNVLFGLIFVSLLALLSACSGGDSSNGGGQQASGPRPPEGYERYTVHGGVARPADAVDVFIVYSPESDAYLPELIATFNRQSAAGTNPATGQPYAEGQNPVYVWGTPPETGSSGTVMQGIVNAVIAPNNANVYRPTIFQPSVSHWLALANFYSRRDLFDLFDSPATAISPVVIATWESRAEALRRELGKDTLGWQDLLNVLNSPNGWCDYGLEDCRRAVYYGHADPNHSSTGLSTTISQYYACARDNGFAGRRLTRDIVNDRSVQNCVEDIQQLVKHYSRRTEDFLEYIGLGPDYLDFLAMEETDVICINTGGTQGDEVCRRPPSGQRLVAIYPEEGTYYHEHPFGIVNAEWVSAAQRDAARLFTDYILSEPAQQRIVAEGYRPATPGIELGYPLVAENGVDPDGVTSVLDVPEAESVVAVQENWGTVKKKADVVLLVDTSGSMQGTKIDQVRAGIDILLDEMSPGNNVALYGFNDRVLVWDQLNSLERNENPIRFHATCEAIPGFDPSPTDINFHGFCMGAGGGTALYTATRAAVDMLSVLSSGEDRIRIVLLLSDGQDTCDHEGCSELRDVVNKIETTYTSLNPVIVVPIAYGEDADIRALQQIADASRTLVIPGDPARITEVLRLLSGYF